VRGAANSWSKITRSGEKAENMPQKARTAGPAFYFSGSLAKGGETSFRLAYFKVMP